MDEQPSNVVTQEQHEALTLEVVETTLYGANIVNGRHVCGCRMEEKRDLGPLDGGGREHLNICKCETHQTIMLHNKFGEVI